MNHRTRADELADYDRLLNGEIPVDAGLAEFAKRSDDEIAEFIEFVKSDGGQEHHLIANSGGLDMYERDQAQAPDLGGLAEQLDGTLAKLADLSKRVDNLVAAQADSIEVTPEQLAALFSEVIDEVGP